MTVYSFFEGAFNPSDPVVWITMATLSCPSPFGYAIAYITVSHISVWDSQSSVLTREGPLASRLRMTPCQKNAWREERAVQPRSLDHRLEKQHILFHSQSRQRSGATEKPRLASGCLSGHSCHCDPGDIEGRHPWQRLSTHPKHTHTAALTTCMGSLPKSLLCF